jgi:REP element-mobilizing transposase RayT
MEEKFRNKYRIDSTRLPGFDYGSDNFYFVTICVKDRKNFFGEICDGQIRLNEFGRAAEQCWTNIPSHFPFVDFDEFVIMPNHVHGILVFDKCYFFGREFVETQYIASLRSGGCTNRFGPQSNNLASVIRGFKIGVKKYAIENKIEFDWQPRFHDHVIRDERALFRIREYIRNNPVNWSGDRNFV